ncbi:MAG: hypothetical protein ACK520_09715 [Inhella sp.]|uniref:hypothetical protein n=1 Tax=Inhella sp. TaxID=1921806 RepID=UPI0022C65EF9|nr:hypothetical protein [Inhella sp.]MCZ8233772.1 hypothetical protein [Inhella sp.]
MASPEKKAFALRVDPALWAEVERLAAQELRSANAQAEVLLREALAKRGIKLGAPKARPAPTQAPAQNPSPDSESS